MTRYAAILAAMLAASGSFAERVRNPVKRAGADPLFQVHKGEKWGYMDRTGKVVIEPRFDDERDFFHGLAAVRIKDKWGYIDSRGAQVIAAQFDDVRDFLDDLAPVRVSRKWGYVDANGQMIIQPAFQSAAEFHEGLARIYVWSKVACAQGEYTSETAPEVAFHLLEDDKSDTPNCFPKGGRFGFIDKSGKVTIQPAFFAAEDFSEGLAAVRVEENAQSKYGYIDQTGKMAIAPRFHQAGRFSEGLAAVETRAAVRENDVPDEAWGFIDKTGVLRIADKFDYAGRFSEGLAVVTVRTHMAAGYVGHDGEFAIAPRFSRASEFSDGLALVCTDEDEGGYIDRSGVMVLRSDSAQWPFSDGLAYRNSDLHEVYIDKSGKEIARYDIPLWPDSDVRGRVLGADGRPAAGIPVRLVALSSGGQYFAAPAVTDRDGLFAFAEVPKGEYLVGINADGLRSQLPFEPRFYPGVANREDAKPVRVSGTTTVEGLDFQIGRRLSTRRILVSAVWPDGRPVTNADVNCRSSHPDDERYNPDWVDGYTNSRGEAVCEVLSDRDFEVTVERLNWSRSSRPVEPIATRPRFFVPAGTGTVHLTIPVDRMNDLSDTERPSDMSGFNAPAPE